MQVENTGGKYSIKHYPDSIQSWKKEGNFFYFYTTSTILEIRVISDTIIRIRYAAENHFQRDFSYALSEKLEESVEFFDIREWEENFEIFTHAIRIYIARENLRITITDMEGKIINQDETGFHWQHYLKKGGKIVYCTKLVQEDECFYGLGDKPMNLNLKGKRLENYATDAYGYVTETDPLYRNIPFYYGLHSGIAYGIFFDNTFRTLFDFGKERDDVTSFWARGGEMNYYFIYGPELIQVAQQYAKITGTAELPPLWALGYHQCRWSYKTDTRVREIGEQFRKRSIPCDALYLDIDYMDGFRVFTWNPETFSEPKKLLSDLANDGFKTVVIIDPGVKVDPDYPIYQEMMSKGFACRRADGAPMEGDVWPGKCVFPDFTNPAVRKWWSGLFRELTDTGVRGVWNDMNEPAVFELGSFPEDVRHDYDGEDVSHRKAHNIYGHLMSKATANGLRKHIMPYRPFLITRSAYSGTQRWSSVWTGDNMSTWEHLGLASKQCQSLSISGLSFAGSDIGGFIGEPDGELYTRWIQLGAFHPLMRTHSASNDTGFDQEPWSFGPEFEAIVKQFIELRYRLLPYFYTTFWQYAAYGTPMLRPLVFVDQQDTNTHNLNDEFLLGDHILVSHVDAPGKREKSIYLPKGTWYYYFTDQVYTGGQHVVIPTPLHEMPIFIRGGAVIPQYPVMQYVGEKQLEEMIEEVYYSTEITHSILYEDAGDHYAYKNGQYNLIRFKQHSSDTYFKLKKKFVGRFQHTYKSHRIHVHGIPFPVSEYVVDGIRYKLEAAQKVSENYLELVLPLEFEELLIR